MNPPILLSVYWLYVGIYLFFAAVIAGVLCEVCSWLLGLPKEDGNDVDHGESR